MDNLHSHKFIIFGGDGINALGVVRSLGEMGIKSYVIRLHPTEHIPPIETSKYVLRTWLAKTPEDVLSILLENFSNEAEKPILFFTDELHTEVFDRHYDELKEKFISYNAGRSGALIKLLNKAYQCELAEECGIKVPKYEIVKKGELPQNVPYPIITKTITSNAGRWKRDMIICQTPEDLQEAYKEIVADRLQIEEYIDSTNEVDLKGFSIRGGEQIFFTHLKRWHYKDPAKGHLMYFEPCKDEVFKAQISQLIQKANYSGIFDAEFIQDKKGDLYFLEVNWRTGMYNYNHTLEGVNLPYLWAKSSMDGFIDDQKIQVKKVNYTTLCELSSFGDVLRHPKQIAHWIHEMRKADVLYYYNEKDMYPCFVAWCIFLHRKVRNILRKVFCSNNLSRSR